MRIWRRLDQATEQLHYQYPQYSAMDKPIPGATDSDAGMLSQLFGPVFANQAHPR